jgi:N-acetylmuramate 1-kinase
MSSFLPPSLSPKPSASHLPDASRAVPAFAVWHLHAETEIETAQLAASLLPLLKAGDFITLSGGLGAGKTAFARALLRQLAQDPALEVPSPTFTLVQSYQTPQFDVIHADLYRISNAFELDAIGFEEMTEGALTLLEWPERLGERLPPHRLDIALDFITPTEADQRQITLTGYGTWRERLERARDVHALLNQAGWLEAQRTHLQGDASSRAYERLTQANGTHAILMISPPRPDGPAIRRGKPYSAIAKLAERVDSFVAMAQGLRAIRLNAPRLYAADLEAGLLLLEDFGSEFITEAGIPVLERYVRAVDVLAALHQSALPPLSISAEKPYALPVYDLEAMLIELELILDWYLPHIGGGLLSAVARSEFLTVWTQILQEIIAAPPTWVMRDYHSPNLMWLPHETGLNQIGVLDFQDAVWGHPNYDLVSLAQDARVDVSPEQEIKLLSLRRAKEPHFSVETFARTYAIMGAQRNTKILGIFARLDKRDRKPAYLKHLPRVENYLRRNLEHPALAPLKAWYQHYLPVLYAGK